MIDSRQNVLKQHTMDLGAVLAAQDILVRVGGYDDIPGSDIIVEEKLDTRYKSKIEMTL